MKACTLFMTSLGAVALVALAACEPPGESMRAPELPTNARTEPAPERPAERASTPSAAPSILPSRIDHAPFVCVDQVEIVLRAPSRAGFAPGEYVVTATDDARSLRFACTIAATEEASSCAPKSTNGKPPSASLDKSLVTMTLDVPGAPQTLDIEVSRSGTSIAKTTITPVFESRSSADGSACKTAFVALGLR